MPLLAKDVSKRHRPGAHPPHPSAGPHAASRIGPGALRCRASLPRRCSRPVGLGSSAVLPLASPASSLSRRQQQSTPLSRFALRARNALVLERFLALLIDRLIKIPIPPQPSPQLLLTRLHPGLSIVRGGLKDRGHARGAGWVGAAGAALAVIVAGP